MNRPRIYNATLHAATPEQSAAGVGAPRGREVPLDATFADLRAMARDIVAAAREEGAEGILTGELSSLAIALYDEARAVGIPVVEALTARQEDEHGRFVFEDRGFRRLDGARPGAARGSRGTGVGRAARRRPSRLGLLLRYWQDEKVNWWLLGVGAAAVLLWVCLHYSEEWQRWAASKWAYTEPLSGIATLLLVFFAWLATQLSLSEKHEPVEIVLCSKQDRQDRLVLPYHLRRGQLSRAEIMGVLSFYQGKDRLDFDVFLREVLEPPPEGGPSALDEVLTGRLATLEIPVTKETIDGYRRRLHPA